MAPRRVEVLENIRQRAVASPRSVAIVEGARTVDYGTLLAWSSAISARLQALGVGPEVRVALAADRSASSLAGLLGILGAGGVVVPLELEAPPARLTRILERTRPAASVVATAEAAGSLGALLGTPLVISSEYLGAPAADWPRARCSADQAACVLFTSGTTGEPKGVVLTHGGLDWNACLSSAHYQLTPEDRLLLFAPLCFDVALEDVFCALSSGAGLVLRPPGAPESFSALKERVERERVTVLDLPTAFWHEWVAELRRPGAEFPRTVRLVVVGGEATSAEAYETWRRANPSCAWFNTYGPTETTVGATLYAPTPGVALDGAPSIGPALEGAQALVLDESLQEAAPDVEGELYIGGEGVARGYWQQPGLTAERFLPHPFEAGARLYRTGDRVVRDREGLLHFRGRRDHQIKLRGHRVELEEIERALLAAVPLKAAVVALRQELATGPALVAYLVPAPGHAVVVDAVAAVLARSLPEYMLPSAYVICDALPKSVTGKIDRARLPPPPPPKAGRAEEGKAPAAGAQSAVAGLFREVLGTEPVFADSGFSELGGTSLAALRLAGRARELLGRELPPGQILRLQTPAALAAWLVAEPAASKDFPPIVPRAPGAALPLSFAQERVFFMEQISPDLRAYRFQAALTWVGPLNAGALRQALDALIRRHEILRTTFALEDDRPVQHVHPPQPAALDVFDLSTLGEGERAVELARISHELVQAPLHSDRLPLIRWALVKLRPEEHRLIHVEHHFVHDGWSFTQLLQEVRALYDRYAKGETAELPPPALQFADFAVWERAWVETPAAARQEAYWKRKLQGAPTRLELPTDRPASASASHAGRVVGMWLTPAQTAAARSLAQSEQATLHVVLVSAFSALLGRISGAPELCVGTTVANRRRPESEPLIGMFVNTVALRVDLAGAPSFRALVRQVRDTALEAYEHQDLPFDRVVQALDVPRQANSLPLIQVDFSSHDSPYPDLSRDGLAVAVDDGLKNGTTKFLLGATAVPRANGQVEIDFEYSTALFDEQTVASIVRAYGQLLSTALAQPDASLPHLSLVGEEDGRRLRRNALGPAMAEGPSLLARVLAQAAQRPDEVALVEDGVACTYAALAARAGAVAASLRALGVKPEDRVLLCAERSSAAVASMLGVWAVGAAFAPLDPELPEERLLAIATQAAPAALVVTRAGLAPALQRQLHGRVLDASALPAALHPRPLPALSPAQAACVLFTSGSTGAPKGVVLTHGGLGWYMGAFAERTGLSSRDRVYQFANLAFDTALEELFSALSVGATLVLRPPGPPPTFAALCEHLRREAVTVLDLPTSYWHEWTRALEGEAALPGTLRLLVIGGEAADRAAYEAWWNAKGCEVLNTYGPTESTIVATTFRARANDEVGAPPPIGAPLAGAEAWVLDADLGLVPAGLPGELYLAGPGLSRGYLADPAQTAERFLPHPFVPGERLYRTGDRAVVSEAGVLRFLGRKDHQVKLRGFRVELAEVEAALHAGAALQGAVAVVRDEGSPSARVVAYVVPSAPRTFSAERLREHLARVLPSYMQPSQLIALEAFPYTAGRKVDRARLPAPAAPVPVSASPAESLHPFAAPLLEVWRDVLRHPTAGLHDDFFALGGHSLLALQLVARVKRTLKVSLTLRDLFAAPTVAQLLQHLRAAA